MRSWLLISILNLLALALSAQTTETAWLQKADQFYADKNYKSALPAYQEAFQLNKQNETTIYRILYSQNELKYYNDAIGFLNTLPVKTIIGNADISEEMCFATQRSTTYEKSIGLLKSAWNQKPNHTGYIQALANVYTNAKKYADAASTYTNLDEMAEPDKVDYENWCYSLNELGRYEEAAAVGKKGIGLYRDHTPLYVEAGYAYKKIKQLPIAKDYFTQAIKRDSSKSTAWGYLGEVYKELGGDKNLDDAVRCFKKVVSMSKASYATYYNLGWCYNEIEDFELAKDNLLKAITLEQSDFEGYLELGYAEYKLGNYSDAIVHFKKTIELNSKSELAHYYAGLTYYMQKDQYNLRKEYDQLKSINSDRAEILEKYLK